MATARHASLRWKCAFNLCAVPRRAGELLFTLAKAYPKGRYHGYDISAKSLGLAHAR